MPAVSASHSVQTSGALDHNRVRSRGFGRKRAGAPGAIDQRILRHRRTDSGEVARGFLTPQEDNSALSNVRRELVRRWGMTGSKMTIVVGTMIIAAGVGSVSLFSRVSVRPIVTVFAAGKDANCTGLVTHELSASHVRVCESVTVTSRVSIRCASCVGGIDLVFIEPLETPGMIDQWMHPDSLMVLDVLMRHPEVSPGVGVVHYDDSSSKEALGITRDLGQAVSPLRAPHQGGLNAQTFWRADHVGAARKAMAMFRDARANLPVGGPQRCRFVVYMAAVAELPGNPDAVRNIASFRSAIRMLTSDGITVLVGCPVPTGEAMCRIPREVAGARRYALVNGKGAIARIVDSEIRVQSRLQPPAGSLLDEGVSLGLTYLPGYGSVPAPKVALRGGITHLGWQWVAPDVSLLQTVTYRVEPLAQGTWPITASLTITDTAGASILVPAQPVTITVAGLCETPTVPPSPTVATPRTATRTPTPTPESTPTLEPTATATATPLPRPLYLPLALVERCDPEHRRADVALVIDTSSSMAGRKLEDAKAAAATFVGEMDLGPGRDQVTVVRYDTEAELTCRLTNARAVIEAAIRNLTSRSGTHIDAGLRTALGELQSPRHLERNTSVMILLTDGVQTGTPGEELRAAEEVRAAGVRLYTIGLGADADAAALREMAGDASRYHFAPDSANLARIYAEIASDILCPAPAGGFWPGG